MQVWTTIRQQKEERNSVQQEPMTNRDVVVAVSFVTAFCETRVSTFSSISFNKDGVHARTSLLGARAVACN